MLSENYHIPTLPPAKMSGAMALFFPAVPKRFKASA
jgi:hypothetical protein